MRKTVHHRGSRFHWIFSILLNFPCSASWLCELAAQLSSREATVLTAHAREVEQTGPLTGPLRAGAGGGGPSHIDHTTAPAWPALLEGGRSGHARTWRYSSAGNLQQLTTTQPGITTSHSQGTRLTPIWWNWCWLLWVWDLTLIKENIFL